MYGFSTMLRKEFDDVIVRVTEALREEGFGILTEIDVKATLRAELGVVRLPYTILRACNPPLVYQTQEADSDISLLLPCSVIIRQEGNGLVIVTFMDPIVVMAAVNKPGIEMLASKMRDKLERVHDALCMTAEA